MYRFWLLVLPLVFFLLICTVSLVLIHSNFFLQTYQVDICRYDSFDLDADQQITETELSILIDITGLVDLDELFEQLDVNKGKPNLYVLC